MRGNLREGRHRSSRLQITLFVTYYSFEGDCLYLTSSLPINCIQRSSPRHCRAEEHHSIQEGIFSRNTIVPHFWHLIRVSSEKISTAAPHFGHLYISTRSLRVSCPGHLLNIYTHSSTKSQLIFKAYTNSTACAVINIILLDK